jgi:hypothetical protein
MCSYWLYRELNFCDNLGRVATYLYFYNFLFNRCPFFIDYRELFINLQFFGYRCVCNFGIIKLYPYINDFEKVCVKSLNVPFTPFTRPYVIISHTQFY